MDTKFDDYTENLYRLMKQVDRELKIEKIMNTTCKDKDDKKDDDKPSPGIVLPIA